MFRKRLLRAPRRLLAAGLISVAGAAGYAQLDEWQRQRIFAPERENPRWWREAPQGTEIFDLVLPNTDRVRSWYWPHPSSAAPTVLYLHGARWNLNGSVFRMERWMDMGFSVLAIDYRGFGESSELLPSEESVYRDVVAALHELVRRQPDPARRFIYGHSLGGAIAIDLAARARDVDVAGIIVEASFTSIEDMLATLNWGRFPGAGLLVTQRFASTRKLAAIARPLLVLHGTADRVVPHSMSDMLHAAATRVPHGLKRLVKIEGGSHSGSVRSPEYEQAVTQFAADAMRYRSAREPRPDSRATVSSAPEVSRAAAPGPR